MVTMVLTPKQNRVNMDKFSKLTRLICLLLIKRLLSIISIRGYIIFMTATIHINLG